MNVEMLGKEAAFLVRFAFKSVSVDRKMFKQMRHTWKCVWERKDFFEDQDTNFLLRNRRNGKKIKSYENRVNTNERSMEN